MAYDFSSPFMAAAIVNRNGTRYPLWSNNFAGANTRPSDVPEDVPSLPYLTEVTIEIELSYLPKISATLTPPFREGVAFLDSELIEYGRSQLEVQIGYVAGTGGQPIISPPFIGLLMAPDVSIGEDITIQLQAQGTMGYSAAAQTGTRVAASGETVRQMLQRLAAGPRGTRELTINFDAADENSDVRRRLDTVSTYAQGGKTDWLAIYELTSQAQCWMVLIGNDIKVISRETAITRTPTKSFRLFDIRGGAIGQSSEGTTSSEYPILSFSSSFAAIYLPGAVRGVVMAEVDDADRTAVITVLDDESEAIARTGRGAVAPPVEAGFPGLDPNTGDGGSFTPGDPGYAEALSQGQEEFARMGNMGINCEIESVGVPDVTPGEVVSVFGVGKRFSNQNYYVQKVIHSIGGGGYTTRLTLISNIAALMEEGLGAHGPEATELATPDQVSDDLVFASDPLDELGLDVLAAAGNF